MEPAARKQIVAQLARAFGAAGDVSPSSDQPLHVLLGKIELPEPWDFLSPTRVLTIWNDWPDERPQFLLEEDVVGEAGEPPRSHSPAYHLGESWRAFSFNFSSAGDAQVRAVQLWMNRFVRETT